MINKIKYFLGIMCLISGCTLVSIGGHKPSPQPVTARSDYAKTAVMITSEDGHSGGTGVILDSRPGVSHILTNKHVCQLVQVGGKVVTDGGTEYNVDSFKVYKKHDLCLIELYADLGVNIKVAEKAPEVYETSVVSGHPSLLPTIIGVGHFSQKRSISFMVDVQPCDGTEKGEDAIACFFMGGRPVYQTLQAQLTSCLIMPGSSGSAVFNAKGELAGMVFAGQPGLGYGYIVPWEYVNDFLKHTNKYESETPNSNKPPRNFFSSYQKYRKYCNRKYVGHPPKSCESFIDLGIIINE